MAFLPDTNVWITLLRDPASDLDAHTLLWFWEGNPALSRSARAAVEDPINDKHVSHVTAWEVAAPFTLAARRVPTYAART
jgi:hypothetical protein